MSSSPAQGHQLGPHPCVRVLLSAQDLITKPRVFPLRNTPKALRFRGLDLPYDHHVDTSQLADQDTASFLLSS
jgi:hypothetical protein